MKIKTIIIITAVVVTAGIISSFLIRNANKTKTKTVAVVPVSSVNSAEFAEDDGNTISVEIISKDSQAVMPDEKHELKSLRVSEGDRVKKGDVLLEYDMERDELKKEMEELTKLALEMKLERQKKDLETMKGGRMPESSEEDIKIPDAGERDEEDEDAEVLAESRILSRSADSGPIHMPEQGFEAGTKATGSWIVPASYIKTVPSVEGGNAEAVLQVLSEAFEETEGEIPEMEVIADDGQDGGDFPVPDDATVQDAIPIYENDQEGLFSEEGAGPEGNPAIPDAVFPETVPESEIIPPNGAESEKPSPETTAPVEAESGSIQESESGKATVETTAPETEIQEESGLDAIPYEEEPGAPIVPDDGSMEELETDFSGTFEIDDGTEEEGDAVALANGFLSKAAAIESASQAGLDAVLGQEQAIRETVEEFRNVFGERYEYEIIDLFGETATAEDWMVSDDIKSRTGDATAAALREAYERLLARRFLCTVLRLNPEHRTSGMLGTEWAKANDLAIREASFEFSSLPQDMRIFNPETGRTEFSSGFAFLNKGIFSGESPEEFLKNTAILLNTEQVIQEQTEMPEEISTEGEEADEYDDDEDEDDEPEWTAEELAEAVAEQERDVKETELQIREAVLAVREYEEILKGRVVRAQMDGIVSGMTENPSAGKPLFTISGRKGLYAKGLLNEESLGKLKPGDVVSGTSYETGATFSAEITEISDYPESGTNHFGFMDGNPNSSFYPFLAYVEDAEDLEVGSYAELHTNTSGNGSDGSPNSRLCLEEYFIRKDGDGRSWCFVRGKDGMLEKRYLEIGGNSGGIISIKSGLRQNDFIAFPYGDGIEEGVQTLETDVLPAIDGNEY